MSQNILLSDYFRGLLACNKNYCYSLIIEAINNGVELKEIYSSVFQPSMVQIGDLWESNQLSVAQEHLATAITQSIMGSLYYKILSNKSPKYKGKVIVTCASNELHELGSRMLADLLEMEGFDVNFLGANKPNQSIIEMIEKEPPLIVAISCTMSFNINHVKDLIALIKSMFPELPVLVGGRAFNDDRKLIEYVGADYYAYDFNEAIELTRKLSVQL